jgi:DNA-binding GntR family transcriptional regulator
MRALGAAGQGQSNRACAGRVLHALATDVKISLSAPDAWQLRRQKIPNAKGLEMAATVAERAYALLKERIITTRMKPGTLIHETALVSDLGLGRTPVREALKRLEAERLVVVLPRRGMYVSEITLAELRELEEVRVSLESLSARLAVQRITRRQIAEFERLLGELGAGRDGSEHATKQSLKTDRRLHELVWKASHNTLLEAECARLFNLSLRMWYLLIDRLEPSDLHEDVFAELLSAIRDNDQKRAEDAMQAHILLFGASVRRHL